MSSSTPPPGKKFKASLACDICRARKSRCDGRRPTCSHCEAAGKTCVYRPTLTLLENDGNILARLNRIETRLDNLDAHGIGDSHSSPVPLPSTLSTTSDISPPNPHFPELHTAATFRMPQCWPRIRLCLTLPNIEPLQYLQRTEQAHPFDVDTRNSLNGSPTIPLSSAIASVEALFEATDLGIDLLELLHHCSPISRNEILTLMRSRCPPQSIDGGEVQLQLTACSVQELLILTIALHQARFEESIIIANYQGFSLSASFDTCFRIALSHFWKVNFLPDETAIPILQVTVIIFSICFLRPHHALRMIEMVGDRLARRAKR
ncbi:MAG: hypothetical protein M1834_007091 [Cirrosporium novae-zelandiae]|nr:MAG: hypothetical protein M1834_007091 [Cirrosporium novae-zelandiae]